MKVFIAKRNIESKANVVHAIYKAIMFHGSPKERKVTTITSSDLYWRLSQSEWESGNVVSLILQLNTELEEYELETDIISQWVLPNDEVLNIAWSEQDHLLFSILIKKLLQIDFTDIDQELNFADESVITVIHLVAAARFLTPIDLDDILASDVDTQHYEYEVGDMVAINTLNGFKAAIIVMLDAIESHCILLDPIKHENTDIAEHELFIINRHHLLAPEFAEVMAGDTATIH